MSMDRTALIVVDVEVDFVEGGSLEVAGGRKVAAGITDLMHERGEDYVAIIATRDAHEEHTDNGGHFAAPGTAPDFATTWPVHCVEGTPGFEYAPELDERCITHHVRKGMGEPAYSGFQGIADDGRTLHQVLTDLGVTDLDVVGIATDYCVKATVIDALALGYSVRVLADLTASVAPETMRTARKEMIQAGAYWAVPAKSEVRARAKAGGR